MEPEDPPRKNYSMKARQFERVNSPGKAPAKSVEHDVHAILLQNRAREQQAGLNEVVFRPVRSRRKRDFWALFLIGNLVFAVAAVLGRHNPLVFTVASAGIAVFSLGLTWIMWFVMDNY